ncbi:MAG: hypothetical protein JST81_09590 [Bacteroidetes bacterium]|nr:hypothetical protein [Bacteroidota bacterium]
MKKQDKHFFKQILQPVVVNINNVCSSIGTQLSKGSGRIFSAADMWKIHSKRKSLLVR